MVCASRGYPFVCVMSEAFSIERRKMMRFLGAKVVLTNPAHKFGGMLQTLLALKAEGPPCLSFPAAAAEADAGHSVGEARLVLAEPV